MKQHYWVDVDLLIFIAATVVADFISNEIILSPRENQI